MLPSRGQEAAGTARHLYPPTRCEQAESAPSSFSTLWLIVHLHAGSLERRNAINPTPQCNLNGTMFACHAPIVCQCLPTMEPDPRKYWHCTQHGCNNMGTGPREILALDTLRLLQQGNQTQGNVGIAHNITRQQGNTAQGNTGTRHATVVTREPDPGKYWH